MTRTGEMWAGGQAAPMVELRMTRQQFMALFSILVDRVRDKHGTQEWIEVTTDQKVTVEDLMQLFSIRI